MSALVGQAPYYEDVGMFWPAWETPERRVADHGYMVRHRADADPATRLCLRRRTVVQAGGHVGVWPIYLAAKFGRVVTFEPAPASFEALRQNVRASGLTNITAYDHGLSDRVCVRPFELTYSGGRSRVGKIGDIKVRLRTLDELGLIDVDAIFLDVEGHELEALNGAAETIRRWQPIIQVEAWPKKVGQLHGWLASHGYTCAGKVSKDEFYVPGRV